MPQSLKDQIFGVMFLTHPLFRRFENELIIGGQKLEWTTYGQDFVFRPHNADETNVSVILGRAILSKKLLSYSRERLIKNQPLWRFWLLPSGEECFLREKYGLFRTSNAELVRFDYPATVADVSHMSGEEITRFLNALTTPDSDLARAREWADMPAPKRVQQLFHLSGGSYEQFESLIQGALVLSGEKRSLLFNARCDDYACAHCVAISLLATSSGR